MIKSNTSHIGFEDTKCPMGVEAVMACRVVSGSHAQINLKQELLARPMSCVPGYCEVIDHHTEASQTIPKSGIKWV